MRTARGKYLGEVSQEGPAGVCSSRGSAGGERTMKKNLISAKIKYGNPIRECWRGAPNRAPTSGPCGKFAFSRKPPLAPFPPRFPCLSFYRCESFRMCRCHFSSNAAFRFASPRFADATCLHAEGRGSRGARQPCAQRVYLRHFPGGFCSLPVPGPHFCSSHDISNLSLS